MPTYEYECQACNHRFELFQSITAKPVRKCPECGRSKVKRLISSGESILFRGSGFYQTDYRSENYKKSAKAESDAASGGTKSDKKDAGSGSTPAATPPPAASPSTAADKK